MSSKPMFVKFNTFRHARASWEALQIILKDYNVEPSMSGLLMETMTNLAVALDNHKKQEENVVELMKSSTSGETSLSQPLAEPT